MHLVEPIIFSLYHVIIRPTKVIKAADKNWAHLNQKHFKNKKFQKISVISSPIFFTEKKSERFLQFSSPKNDIENQNIAIFEKVLKNIGRPDDDMI